jgi:proteic killer suppression protein
VILSFRDKRTRDFAEGKRVKAFFSIERSARLKLDRLEAATSTQDLAALPGNRFGALHSDRRGQFSIRINDQWRIALHGKTARRDHRMSRLWTITRRQSCQ